MRNLFDQYKQPENQLTHALISTLHNDRSLVIPFLDWLGEKSLPPIKEILINQQSIPGDEIEGENEGSDGLPDACLYSKEGWAVLIESKVQSRPILEQLIRHIKTASKRGYPDPTVILLSVDEPQFTLPEKIKFRAWRDVYAWFNTKMLNSEWARRFVEYMHVFETKMISQEYNIRGTLTMFSGFQFNQEYPYTYLEGKRLIRLLGEEFRKNTKLIKSLGIDPHRKGRTAINRGTEGNVWDLIPLKGSKGTFTSHPHATIGLWPTCVEIAITIPNGVKGGIKKHLLSVGMDGFRKILEQIERDLKPIIEKVPAAKPNIYITQRHYRSQRSEPETDGRIEVDLRTLLRTDTSSLKHQPGWLDAIFNILTMKQTNLQFGIRVFLPYKAEIMRSAKAEDIMADVWITLKPFIMLIRHKGI